MSLLLIQFELLLGRLILLFGLLLGLQHFLHRQLLLQLGLLVVAVIRGKAAWDRPVGQPDRVGGVGGRGLGLRRVGQREQRDGRGTGES